MQQGFSTQRLDEIDPWLERVNTKLEKHLDDILMLEEDTRARRKDAPSLSYGASARTARHADETGACAWPESGSDDAC